MPEAAPDHRALIEIPSWDWPLHVGMAPPSMPPEQRRQGDLFYVQRLEISGRVLTPVALQGRSVRISISTFGPDLTFGPEGLEQVGQVHPGRDDHETVFEASLLLPRDALPGALTSLASVWKRLHLWTTAPPPQPGDITDFAFCGIGPEAA